MHKNIASNAYIKDKPRLSYVESTDPWLTRKFVSSVEVLFGRRGIERAYRDIKSRPFDVKTFFSDALSQVNIEPDFRQCQLAKIPNKGPIIFLANHPFGVVDGLILCDLAVKARGDFRILLNSVLCQDKDLAPYFLPIDFSSDKQAVKNNILSKRVAKKAINEDIPVLIFPSGMVSTARKFGLGSVKDGPWSTFAAKLVQESKATVIPVFFHGQNSRKFQIASHISMPLRLALLLHEVRNKFNSSLKVDIGDPITWDEMAQFSGRKRLTEFLYAKVQEAGENNSI